MYDTDGGGQGIGEHGLMGSGNWQNPPNPAHMSAWSKMELGWIAPTIVGPVAQNYNMPSVEMNAAAYQLNIMEEKFNRKTFQPLSGTASLHCGLTGSAAAARNWAGGSGYGNSWDESACRDFHYNGSGSVALEFDVSYDLETGYDFGYVKILVDGTETTLRTYNGIGSLTDVSVDITPYLGAGAKDYQIIAQLVSDFGWSDEDGDKDSGSLGPFKLDNISVTGGGESHFADFEQNADGWHYDFAKSPNKEYFLVENHNKTGAQFGQNAHGAGLIIWHIEQNVAHSRYTNTGGTAGTGSLKPAGVTVRAGRRAERTPHEF